MTVGAIIGLSFLTIVVVIAVGAVCVYYKKARIVSVIAGVIILAAAWSIGVWYFNGTEAGKRAIKTQQSNFGGGIERRITVYDVEGDVIATYEGRFDIEYDNDRILFDDEEGLRHIIYYPTGNVIVDELAK
ncbi:MAG: hypothetical protein J5517_02740 [Eubacterium sp.]|nr:hypothetical protein [Eubacterium sp.]